jgi:hypothetical protein
MHTKSNRKCEENISVGRPRRRWEDNIKRNIKEIWYEDLVWANSCENGNESLDNFQIDGRGMQHAWGN